jgi:L-serine dehydratase
MGLFGGLLGWEPTDQRLARSPELIREAGINVDIKIAPIEADHPSTYKMTLSNSRETHTLTAISTGGGAISIIEIDGAKVSLAGDYFETLIYFGSDGDRLRTHLKEKLQADEIHLLRGENTQFVEVKSQEFFAPNTASELCATFDISSIKHIGPVVPVLSRRGMDVPFITGEEMMEYNQDKGLDLWELAVHYECARGAITDKEVMETMIAIIDIMENAIHIGLAGTEYADRILGYQSGTFQDHMENRRLIEGGVLSQIIMYTTALMESKSAMGLCDFRRRGWRMPGRMWGWIRDGCCRTGYAGRWVNPTGGQCGLNGTPEHPWYDL